ncbi:AraC family transcriptional regulator [Flavobacterium sediminilitoris]|uniref:AraC family transcriptional regulator n=1 Tax=Flavobacterium sediminilitoris TaxID=2024526 RepID=A0ABY4HMT1_9FLAO|nr:MULTISPECIES: helix-turn-helix domain-containing protein [Flavobacterium]UOX33993.1 AraC family transcriptional regulator [Flavobacterium sediminilitoris]
MKQYPVYEIENFEQNIFYNNLYVNSFTEHLKKHHFIEKLHRHNFYLLVLFTNGTGKHTIDFDTFDITKGSLFLMQPGQIHSWKLSPDIDGYIVFYSKEIFNLHFKEKRIEHYPFFQSFKNNPEILLSDSEIGHLQPYFDLMIDESKNNKQYKRDKLLNLLDVIHIEITRIYSSETNQEKPIYNYKLKQFDELLEKYFKTEKSPSFYADKMAITLKHLNRIVKATVNKTVTELITQRVILESKRLMVERKLTINQIADELGFSSPNYFTKLFKKHEGIKPKEFIKQMSN